MLCIPHFKICTVVANRRMPYVKFCHLTSGPCDDQIIGKSGRSPSMCIHPASSILVRARGVERGVDYVPRSQPTYSTNENSVMESISDGRARCCSPSDRIDLCHLLIKRAIVGVTQTPGVMSPFVFCVGRSSRMSRGMMWSKIETLTVSNTPTTEILSSLRIKVGITIK